MANKSKDDLLRHKRVQAYMWTAYTRKELKKKEYFVIQTQTSSEWITEVMSQAAKESQQGGIQIK